MPNCRKVGATAHGQGGRWGCAGCAVRERDRNRVRGWCATRVRGLRLGVWDFSGCAIGSARVRDRVREGARRVRGGCSAIGCAIGCATKIQGARAPDRGPLRNPAHPRAPWVFPGCPEAARGIENRVRGGCAIRVGGVRERVRLRRPGSQSPDLRRLDEMAGHLSSAAIACPRWPATYRARQLPVQGGRPLISYPSKSSPGVVSAPTRAP